VLKPGAHPSADPDQWRKIGSQPPERRPTKGRAKSLVTPSILVSERLHDPMRTGGGTEPNRNEAAWPGIITHRGTRGSVNRHLQKPSFGRWPTRPWRVGVNRSPERQPRTQPVRAAVTWNQSRCMGLGAPAAALASEGARPSGERQPFKARRRREDASVSTAFVPRTARHCVSVVRPALRDCPSGTYGRSLLPPPRELLGIPRTRTGMHVGSIDALTSANGRFCCRSRRSEERGG